jgi:hypothetical protein
MGNIQQKEGANAFYHIQKESSIHHAGHEKAFPVLSFQFIVSINLIGLKKYFFQSLSDPCF